MKRTSIVEDTPILPIIIADNVVMEVAAFADRNTLDPTGMIDLAEALAEKAEHIYLNNRHFAERIQSKGNLGRDYLYMFMRHWMAALLKEGYPEVFKIMPESFFLGTPLKEGN